MKAEFALPSPGNWIQLEKVCLKVWGIIWRIPDKIDYNSSNAQGQDGVDIYGVPKDEVRCYGIQCKDKRLHLKSGEFNSLTKGAIDEMISKAESFKPELAHLVIATSLYKDKALEEYVRELNGQRIAAGKFSVQICFWEFIAERIQDHKNLFQWYMTERDLVSGHAVKVTLDNGLASKTFWPLFVREKQVYRQQLPEERKLDMDGLREAMNKLEMEAGTVYSRAKIQLGSVFKKKKNKSEFKERPEGEAKVYVDGELLKEQFPRPSWQNYNYLNPEYFLHSYEVVQACYFRLVLKNTGMNVIEDYKMEFQVFGPYQEFGVIGPTISEAIGKTYQLHSRKTGYGKGRIKPSNPTLVQEDKFESAGFYVVPPMNGETEMTINWKLISRDFSVSGSLQLVIKPVYNEKETLWYIGPEDSPSVKYVFANIRKKGVRQPNF